MSKGTILVVDDESRMRKLVKDFLKREDYTVLEAGDGMEAMDIFGCDDAEDGRMAGVPGDPEYPIQYSDHYADGKIQ